MVEKNGTKTRLRINFRGLSAEEHIFVDPFFSPLTLAEVNHMKSFLPHMHLSCVNDTIDLGLVLLNVVYMHV